jgi:hypothetical protein
MAISIRRSKPVPTRPALETPTITSRPRRPVQVEYRPLGRRA